MSSAQPARLLALGFFAVFLAGCGGGGGTDDGGPGGGGSTPGAVIGKVVGSDGGPLPGAQVTIDNSSQRATTLSQGAFQLSDVSTGVHRVYAQASVSGVSYSGSTQVLINSNATASNAVIQLSPSSQQAAISGSVTDTSGRPLRDARVFLSVPSSASAPGTVQSLVAFADFNGNYQIQNVPTSNAQYVVAASLLGYQNQSTNLGGVTAGQTTTINFQLAQSSNQSVLTPQNVLAQSFTQPSSVLSPQARLQPHASASTGVYEQIRRALSPAYARAVSSLHPASQIKHLRAQSHDSGFGSYAITTDVLFDESARSSLSGFRVYLSEGNASLTPYDFLQDPLANAYTDLNPSYFADQQYNFAVSAVNTDGTETALSTTSTVVPLSQMLLNAPSQNQILSNPLTVSWQPVNGANAYAVFVYNQYPTIGAQTVAENLNIGGSTTSYTFPNSFTAGDYWVVAAASADSGAEISVSQITLVHVR